jgi:hypothetical protein
MGNVGVSFHTVHYTRPGNRSSTNPKTSREAFDRPEYPGYTKAVANPEDPAGKRKESA